MPQGNERFGRPRNPDFLLRPGELLEAFAGLTVVAFEQGEVALPRPAVIQRIAAVNGPLGRLPEGTDYSTLRSAPTVFSQFVDMYRRRDPNSEDGLSTFQHDPAAKARQIGQA